MGMSLRGQRQCEKIIHIGVWVSGMLGLLIGMYLQSTQIMVNILLAGLSMLTIVVGPPWGWKSDTISWVSRTEVEKFVAKEQLRVDEEKEMRFKK